MKNNLLYTITPYDLAGHRYKVRLTIQRPDPKGQVISLPTWIPGSYLVRDFSKNIETITANHNTLPLTITPLSNHCWQIEPTSGVLHIDYVVYAWDLSVRTAHLDETHGFFNGTSVFLQAHGFEDQPCLVDIRPPRHIDDWKVYTSLPLAHGHAKTAQRHGFGMYCARNYDALIDFPVEMGTPKVVRFVARGVIHEMAFTGLLPNVDFTRIARDVARICNAEIQLFEPKTKQPPFADSSDGYVFLVMVTGHDYGGLEHRNSTALVCSRNDLPVFGQDKLTPGYQQFLGLVSHEYFHSWNVKRIKPARFAPYDLTQATPTKLLWIFEGFTSYYDDLILYRTGLIDKKAYLTILEKTINTVLHTGGRLKQTVAQSSFDAWTKYYKQDENSSNAIVSYYTQGSLTALCLDLYLQKESKGRYSLDDVMRYLWQHYGKTFYTQDAKGLEEEDFARLVKEATQVSIEAFLRDYVEGLEELPLKELLQTKQIDLVCTLSKEASLNIKTKSVNDRCVINVVQEHGAAHLGGLSAGDTLVAIDSIQVTGSNLDALLERYHVGQQVVIHVFRRDELRVFKVKLMAKNAVYTLVDTKAVQA